jgi:hypothetical protein
MKTVYSLAPLIFSTCLGAQASTTTFSELPGEVQGCIQAGTCFLSTNSNADFGNASFFDYTTFSPLEGMVNRQLIRYELTPPSARAHGLTSTYDSQLDDFSYSALGAPTGWQRTPATTFRPAATRSRALPRQGVPPPPTTCGDVMNTR